MLLWRKLRDVHSVPSDPARAALTPLLCAADSDLGTGGNCREQLLHPGACDHPLCAAGLGRGVELRGQLCCSQGTLSLLGSVVSGTPGREGQHLALEAPWLCGKQVFVSFSLA